MNLKADFVCVFSAVSLTAEVTGKKRKWLVMFLVNSTVLSAVPTSLGLWEFFTSPRSKVRRIRRAFFQLVLDEAFACCEPRRRLGEESLYCHQGYDTTVNCIHKDHLIKGEGPVPLLHVETPNKIVMNKRITFSDLEFSDIYPLTVVTATSGCTALSRDFSKCHHRGITRNVNSSEDSPRIDTDKDRVYEEDGKTIYFVEAKPSALKKAINLDDSFKMKHEINREDLNVMLIFFNESKDSTSENMVLVKQQIRSE